MFVVIFPTHLGRYCVWRVLKYSAFLQLLNNYMAGVRANEFPSPGNLYFVVLYSFLFDIIAITFICGNFSNSSWSILCRACVKISYVFTIITQLSGCGSGKWVPISRKFIYCSSVFISVWFNCNNLCLW